MLDLVRLLASLGKVQQEEHVRDELLSTAVAFGDEFTGDMLHCPANHTVKQLTTRH